MIQRGRHGHDHMIVGFTITYAIGAITTDVGSRKYSIIKHAYNHIECNSTVCNSIINHLVGCDFMVFNTPFNNISVISWRSVLLVEETGGPGENHRPATRQTLSHNVVHLAPIGS
jgi:glyoxylate utilization-related uncharacterized protein